MESARQLLAGDGLKIALAIVRARLVRRGSSSCGTEFARFNANVFGSNHALMREPSVNMMVDPFRPSPMLLSK